MLILISMRSLLSCFVYNLIILPGAFAQEAAPAGASPQPNSLMMNLPMILLFVALLYFMVIAPQRKQQKQQQDFQKSLVRGDEVVTASGILGRITGLTDRVVTLEVAPETEIKILRSQVQARLKELKVGEALT